MLNAYKPSFKLINSKTTQLVKMCFKLYVLALQTHAIVHAFTTALDPTVPWNLLPISISSLIPTSSEYYLNLPLIFLRRILIFIYIYVSMKIYSDIAITNNMVNLFIPTFCFTTCLKVVQKQLKFNKVPENLFKCLKTYREIQLIVIIYNSIHRKVLFPLLLIAGIMCLSGSAYVLISVSTQMQVTAILIFVNLFVVGIACILICFYFAALRYKISVSTLVLFNRSLLLNNLNI